MNGSSNARGPHHHAAGAGSTRLRDEQRAGIVFARHGPPVEPRTFALAGNLGGHERNMYGPVLPHDEAGDAAHDAMLEVRAGAAPGELAIWVRNLPPTAAPEPRPALFREAELAQERADAAPRWGAQARDMAVLEAAAARDRGNRNGTWTAEEVAAADRLDDAYMQDDLGPVGGSFYFEGEDESEPEALRARRSAANAARPARPAADDDLAQGA